MDATQLTLGTVPDARLSPSVALLNANQTFTGLNSFSDNISLLDATKSITFPAVGGANAPMMYMFASGIANADRMVIGHSPSYPTWGLQYQDNLDKFNFLSGGFPVMTIDLGAQRVAIATRLGIGIPTPSFPLDVVAEQAVGRFITTNSANGSVLELDNSSPALDYYGAINFQGGIGQVGYRTNNIMSFRTAGAERLRIDGNGNVGIGTTLPDATSLMHLLLPSSANVPNVQIQSLLGDNGFGIKFVNPDQTWFVGPNMGNWPDDRFTIMSGSALKGLIIATNGNVAIDSAAGVSPFATLTVDGTIGFPTVSTPAMYVYPSGTSNPEKRLIVHSPAFPEYGLYYEDNGDRFVMKSSAADTTPSLVVDLDSNWVAIGTDTPKPGYELSVNGQIVCEEILVQDSSLWPDYVFQEGYPLKPLEEVEAHIKERKHLPGIPTAKEVAANGISVGDMQKRTMEKIEELTLYVIDQNKRLTAQEKLILELQAKLEEAKTLALPSSRHPAAELIPSSQRIYP